MTPIRPAAPTDAAAIAAIFAPIVRDTWISFATEPPTAESIKKKMAELAPRFPWLVAEANGAVVGYAYASKHRDLPSYQWSCEVSIYIAEGQRRKGVARELYGELFNRLRKLGYYNAYAGITQPNPASIGLHESLGFRHIGTYQKVGHKLGAWRDVGWWALTLQPHAPNPVPLPPQLAPGRVDSDFSIKTRRNSKARSR